MTINNIVEYTLNEDSSLMAVMDLPEIRVRVINQWENSIKPFYPIFDIISETHKIIEVKDDSYDLILDGFFGEERIVNQNAMKLYYIGEAFTPDINKYDLSIGFDYIDKENYLRFPLYHIYFSKNISTEYERGICEPNKKFFGCFLVSNNSNGWKQIVFDNTGERANVFHALSEYKFVASGGKHLNNIGYVVPQKDTMSFLSQCKFIIAYENTKSFPGYITEKVFQAYFAGAIPIYYTHSSSLNDINPESIVAQNYFPSRTEMINYIKELDQDDEKYCKKWNEKIIIDPQSSYEYMKGRLRVKIRNLLSKYFSKE